MTIIKRIFAWFLSVLIGLLFPASRFAPDYDNYSYRLTETQILYNSLPHPYLAGYYSEDGSEITINGTKVLDDSDVDGERVMLYVEDVVIPDEINGVPVTAIEKSAFENDVSDHYIENGDYIRDSFGHPLHSSVRRILVGNNVRYIGDSSLYSIPIIIIGKNVVEIEGYPFNIEGISCFDGISGTIYCYEDSAVYRHLINPNNYDGMFTEDDNPWFTKIILIDESHLTSETALIDENLFVRGLPHGLTAQTLTDYVSVDGDALLRVRDETITTGTKIELVNQTYGTVDNIYTVICEGDLDGDGAFYTEDDCALLRRMNARLLSPQDDPAAFAAADFNGDGQITSTDVTYMRERMAGL